PAGVRGAVVERERQSRGIVGRGVAHGGDTPVLGGADAGREAVHVLPKLGAGGGGHLVPHREEQRGDAVALGDRGVQGLFGADAVLVLKHLEDVEVVVAAPALLVEGEDVVVPPDDEVRHLGQRAHAYVVAL